LTLKAKTDPACFNESGFVDLNDDEDAAGDFLSTSEPYFTFQV
jgi:hypothetical protein